MSSAHARPKSPLWKNSSKRWKKGQKSEKKIEDFKDKSGDMKTKDFAFAFGVHQKQHVT